MKQNSHISNQNREFVDSIDGRLHSAVVLRFQSQEWSLGDPHGIRRLKHALAQIEHLAASAPDLPHIIEQLAACQLELAERLRSVGELAEAERLAQFAHDVQITHSGSPGVAVWELYRDAQSHLKAARTNDGEDSRESFRAAAHLFQELCQSFPDVLRYRELLAESEYGLAQVSLAAGETRKAGRCRRLANRLDAESRRYAGARSREAIGGRAQRIDCKTLDQAVSLSLRQRNRADVHGTRWLLEGSRFLQVLLWGLLPLLLGLWDARLFAATLPIGMLFLLHNTVDDSRLTRRIRTGLFASTVLQAFFVGELHGADVLCLISLLLSAGAAFLGCFNHERVYLSNIMLAKVGGIACRTDEIAQQWALWIARHAPAWLEVLLCEPSAEGSVGRVRWPMYWVAGCVAVAEELVKFTQFLCICVARELGVPPRPPNPVPRESRRNTSASWAVFLRRPLHLARGDDVPLCLSTT